MISKGGAMRIREDERNRRFSEQVDRILAGGRAAPGADVDDDFRSALDFAQDIAAMTPAPRAGFQAALDSRLRTRMAELEEEGRVGDKRSWWQRLAARPAWLVAAAAVFIVAIGILVWAAGVLQPAAQPSIISASASTSKATYASGEQVNIRVDLENVSGSTLFIDRYPPNLSIMDAQTNQPVYTTAAGEHGISVPAGNRLDFAVQWDQRDANGQIVAPGRYYIELEDFIDRDGQPIPLRFARPVEFEVLN
jgi:hypothetical protein